MSEGYALTITYVNGQSKVILTDSLNELVQKVYITYELEQLLGGNIIKIVNVVSSTQAMDALAGDGAWKNDVKDLMNETDNALDDDKSDLLDSEENDLKV